MYNSKIDDISGIQYIENADKIDLSSNDISDLSPLEDSNIKELNLQANKNIADFSPLLSMKNLTSLGLISCEIFDVSLIGKMTGLQELQIKNNHIIDFRPLINLKNTKIDLEGQQSFFEDKLNLSENKFSLNLSKYVNPGGKISSFGLFYVIDANGDDVGEIELDKSKEIVNVTEIDGSGTLAIGFSEEFDLNGTKYELKKVVFQDYTIGGVKTKPVTMKVGDKWNDKLGFVQAVDSSGNTLELSDFEVDATKLDTSKAGKYEVTYTAKDNPEITGTSEVTVEKGNSNGGNNNGSNTGNVTEMDEMLLSSKKTDSIAIYDQNGNKISDKKLSGVTDFSTTKKSVVNGVTYYQVGDDEWVRESDVAEYFEYSGIVQTNSDSIKKLSNLNGESSNRGLEQTTDWQADRYSYINGNKHYRVSNNEWVEADQTFEITPVNGVLTINEEATLYHDNGKKSDRGLAVNSTFVTDKTATINGEKMYRVSTNEWVPVSQVTLN